MGRGRTRYNTEGQLTLDLWGEEPASESDAQESAPELVEHTKGDGVDEPVRTTGDDALATLGTGRVRALEDPVAFFTDLGEQVQTQVSDLARLLAGPDPAREAYKQKVARLQAATRTAEEVVMAQLVWTPAPELTLSEAREVWEQTRPVDEALISWAERFQDSPDLMPSTAELEDKAKTWAVTPEFLTSLVVAPIPRKFLAENQATMAEAATLRFLREVR